MKRMFVLSILFLSLLTANSQSVGIGTSSPGEKLDVVGNVKAGSPASNAIIGTHPTYGNLYSAFWKQGYDYSILTDGTNTFLNAPSGSGGIYFRTANINRVTITGGTNTPHLEVAGTGFQKLRITSSDGGGTALEFAQAGRSWQISGGGVVSFDYGTDLSTFLNHSIDINGSTLVLEP